MRCGPCVRPLRLPSPLDGDAVRSPLVPVMASRAAWRHRGPRGALSGTVRGARRAFPAPTGSEVTPNPVLSEDRGLLFTQVGLPPGGELEDWAEVSPPAEDGQAASRAVACEHGPWHRLPRPAGPLWRRGGRGPEWRGAGGGERGSAAGCLRGALAPLLPRGGRDSSEPVAAALRPSPTRRRGRSPGRAGCAAWGPARHGRAESRSSSRLRGLVPDSSSRTRTRVSLP